MNCYKGVDNTSKFIETFSTAARPTHSIDTARYLGYLDGEDLTPEQKNELLQSLLSVIVTFVELCYGVHPLQEACGKDHKSDGESPAQAADAVLSEHQNTAKPLEKPAPPGTPEVT